MYKKLLLILIILAITSLGCSLSGGDKAQPETTPTTESAAVIIPTTKPTREAPATQPMAVQSPPTEVPVAEAPITEIMPEVAQETSSNAPRYFLDDFDGELNEVDWSIEYYSGYDDDYVSYEISQQHGGMEFYINSEYLYLYRFYEAHTYDDIRIDFEVQNRGVNTNNIGAVCRLTDFGWYEFITTSGGYYSIMRYDDYGDEELASGGIHSIRFGNDKVNTYTFICSGAQLILLVNGEEIAYVMDWELQDEGFAGINVSAEKVLPVTVEFKWLQFSQP